MSPTKTDDVIDAEYTETEDEAQTPDQDDTEPDFGGTGEESEEPSDEVPADPDYDDDYEEVSDEAFTVERSFKNAIPAPTGVWLPMSLFAEHSPEDNKFDPGNPQIIVYAEHLSPEFGGRRYPYRTYISKVYKPKEFEGRKPRAGDKAQVPPIHRLVAAAGITTPQRKGYRFSEVPAQLDGAEIMCQLAIRKAQDREFRLPAVFGEQCAMVSPVNGHHFTSNPYDIVKDAPESLHSDPAYAIYTDEESEEVTVLKPRYDEAAIRAQVKTEQERMAQQMDESSLTPEEQDDYLARAKKFSERRARNLAYRNPMKGENTQAGVVLMDKFGKEMTDAEGEPARFGMDDDVFTHDGGYGEAPGTEILDYEGAPFMRQVSVTAVKGTRVEDSMSLEELLKTERLAFGKFAPVPERVLGVKEEPGRDPHYQVIWAHVGRLAVSEDDVIARNEEVDALDLEASTGEVVTLFYGADSAWHLKAKSDDPA